MKPRKTGPTSFKLIVKFWIFISILVCHLKAMDKLPSDWGNTVNGFQMAASLDQSNAVIHCWIRNATSNTVDYPSFDFGYSAYISLEVQYATNWTSFHPLVFARSEALEEPPPYELNSIGPLAVIDGVNQIVNSPFRGGDIRYSSYANLLIRPALEGPDRPIHTKLVKAIDIRWSVLTNLCKGDTFSIDLTTGSPFASRELTNLSSMKARVSQRFRSNGGQTVSVLTSADFFLPPKK